MTKYYKKKIIKDIIDRGEVETMKRDFRLPFINIDEDGVQHVTYQPSALEQDKPYYIHWNDEDWAIIKKNDHVDWYKKEKKEK